MPTYTRRRYGGADQAPNTGRNPQQKTYYQRMKEKSSQAMIHLGNKGMIAIRPGLDHLHATATEVGQHAYGEAGIVGSQATGMAKNAAKGAITSGRIAAQTALRTVPLSSSGGKKYNRRSKVRKDKRNRKIGGKSRKSKYKSRRSTKTGGRSRKYRR